MREGTLTEARTSEPGDREADEALDMDEEAFRLFYQRTSRPLWAYLSRMSGDRQLADDLLQETYYRMLRNGPLVRLRRAPAPLLVPDRYQSRSRRPSPAATAVHAHAGRVRRDCAPHGRLGRTGRAARRPLQGDGPDEAT